MADQTATKLEGNVSDEPFDWSASRFEGPHASPGFRLWQQHQAWQRMLNAALAPLGLTQPQFSVLAVIAWLSREDADVTQADLCRFASLERMAVSQIARKLGTLDFIRRAPSSRDGRAITLALTPAGRDVLASALPLVEDADGKFFATDQGDRRVP